MKMIHLFLLVVFLVPGSLNVKDWRCFGSQKNCYCDSQCHLYRDCCDRFDSLQDQDFHASCLQGYYVIDKCSGNQTSESLRVNCETKSETNLSHLIFQVPVYGIDDKHPAVYKNAFCAMCNKVNTFQYAEVVPKISKPQERNDSQEMEFVIPKSFKRLCYRDVIDTCHDDSMYTFVKLCQSLPTFYIKEKINKKEIVYRNAFCYLCNKLLGNDFFTSFLPMAEEIKAINFNTWCLTDCQSLLESFRANGTVSRNDSQISSCANNSHLVLIEKIIFLTCKVISIMFLVFLVMVYTCVEEQNSRAGKITMCLALSVLLLTVISAAITSMENPSNTFCFYFSLPYLYFYLSSFFWMTLYAIDVCQSLMAPCVMKDSHFNVFKSKRFRLYLSVGYIGPLVFVLIAMTIQLVNENSILSAGLGERQCFINRYIGGLIWFFIPLCMCLFINIIVCGWLYSFIFRTNRQTVVARQTNKARKQNFLLCVKLSILFGIVWLPAFIGIFTDNYVLNMAGGIISSLHGALLSFSLIFGVRTSGYIRTLSDSISKFSIRRFSNLS